MRNRFPTGAEPTGEDTTFSSSTNLAIADGDQVADIVDGDPQGRLQGPSSGATTFRYDMALDRRVTADGFVIVNHNMRDVLPVDDKESVKLFHDTDAVFAGSTEVTVNSEFAHKYGAEEYTALDFDGDTDVITLPDDPAFALGDEFTIIFNQKRAVTGVRHDMYGSLNGDIQLLLNSNDTIVFSVLGGASVTTTATVNTDQHEIAYVYSDGKVTIYMDGVEAKAATATSAITTTSGNESFIGSSPDGVSNNYHGQMKHVPFYNRAFSAAEILAHFNTPAFYPLAVDKWGSQEEMPNQVDRDFSGPSAWADVNLFSYDETGDLTIESNGTGQYCELVVASAPMEAGFIYRLKYDLANSSAGAWDIEDFTGVQTFGTVAGNGTDQIIEFTVDAGITGGIRIVATFNDSRGNFDNFSLARLGAVASYESSGIATSQSLRVDRSSNALDGTIVGAEGRNDPGNSIYFAKFTEVNARYWFLQTNPATAKTFIGQYKIGQWDLTKTFRPTVNPDIAGLSETLDYSGIDVIEKYGGGRDLNERHGKAPAWAVSYSFFLEADRTNFKDFLEQTRKRVFYFSLNADDAEPIIKAGRILGNPEIVPVAFGAYTISFIIEEKPLQG